MKIRKRLKLNATLTGFAILLIMLVTVWSFLQIRAARQNSALGDDMRRASMEPLVFSIEAAGLWAEAVRNKVPLAINEYEKEHPAKKGLPPGHVSLRRLMSVPVLVEGKVAFVAVVANRESDYTDEDLKQLESFISSARIIYEKKKNDDALRAKEAELISANRKLSDIIEFLPDATFVVDVDKRIIAWNRAMEEMTGIGKEDIVGQGDYSYTIPFYGERRRHLMDLLDGNDEELASRYENISRLGETLYGEAFTPALHGGRGAHVFAAAAPLFDIQGRREWAWRRCGASSIVTADISVRKERSAKGRCFVLRCRKA